MAPIMIAQAFLHRDGAPCAFQSAGKLDQKAVANEFNFPAAETDEAGTQKPVMTFEQLKRQLLIPPRHGRNPTMSVNMVAASRRFSFFMEGLAQDDVVSTASHDTLKQFRTGQAEGCIVRARGNALRLRRGIFSVGIA